MNPYMDPTAPSGGADYRSTDPSMGDSPVGDRSTGEVAKDEARNVGQTAAQAGSEVAGTAAEQVKQVTHETKRQAQDLLAQGRSQATEQVRSSQQQAAGSLSALAGELRSMARHDDSSADGPAHDLVRQATGKVDDLADWLQSHEPGDLLDELRRFARRRPGTFLLGAAVAGIVAGRLTTGVVAAHREDDDATGLAPQYDAPQYDAPQYDAPQYDAPQYGAVQNGTSQFAAPVYGAPQYDAPQYDTPQYDTPQYDAPQYDAPQYDQGQYGQPTSAPTEAYPDVPPADYETPVSDAPAPPLPYGNPPPGTESNWADPQRDRQDGGRQ